MAKIERNQNKLVQIKDSLQHIQSVWGPYYYVHDLDRAIAFYTKRLGFALKQRMGDQWAEVKLGSSVIGLHATDASAKRGSGPTVPARAPGEGATVSLVVEDLAAFVEKLKIQGVVMSAEGITKGGGGQWTEFQDSEGNWLHLIQVG